MKEIKKAIIIILVCIIILIGIMILLLSKKNENEGYDKEFELENLDEGKVFESNNNGFQALEDPNIFFTITNILSNYFAALNYDTEDIQNNKYNIQNSEEQTNVILDILDKEYIKTNKINEQNLEKYIDKIQNNYKVIPLDIRVKYGENIITYILSIYLEDIETKELSEKFYIIRVDNKNGSYSVEPILDKVNDIDEISVKEIENRIEKNDNNRYEIETISIERLVKIYMDQFTNMMLNYTEIAYNKYLSDEYKNERFGNVNQFKKYVEDNKEEIQNLRASQYTIENNEGGKRYIILDQYNNTYQFYETTTMSYKVEMDTYTIPSEKFKTTYQSASSQDKVMMNIDKWIQMLNTRNYAAAYQVLNETFRDEKFGSEEQFETVIRENLPLHYKIEFNNFSEEGQTYLMDLTLKDSTEESKDEIKMTVVMQLQEDTDFVMSFSME